MRQLILVFALLSSYMFVQGQHTQQELDKVKEACFDYINTFYQADTALAYKSVHKSVRKTGFYFQKDEQHYSEQLEMPFNDLVSLAKRWNKDGSQTNESSPKDVVIFEVSDQTASAKVTAVWGIDYLSLMKENDKWMIVNVLWQSPPKYSVTDSN